MQGTRTLAMALLLRAHGQMSVRDLARVLGVSERTVARDRQELADDGVRVVTARGPGGGYALAPGTRIDLRHFAWKLAYGVEDGETSATPIQEQDRAGDADERLRLELRALADSMPYSHRDAFMRAIEQEATAALTRAASEGDDPSLHTVRLALWQRKRLRIQYAGHDGTVSERVVEPYVLLSREGRWYLVGYCHWREDVRAFAVARIAGATGVAEGVAGAPEAVHLPVGGRA
jgi:predicted DNA-binding transcriptional regulator YafY